jgi:hypothetical protein
MLFDLRSPHRRRVIKTVYVFLALLIGIGLVGFGVGTGTNLNPFSSAGGGGGTSTGEKVYINALANAQKKAKASPTNPAAWAKVGTAAYALATLPVNFATSVGYNAAGHAALDKLKAAWTTYLALAPAKPDTTFAGEVVAAFGTPPPSGTGIGDYKTAESAQEVVAANSPTLYTEYEFLAYYAYLANEPSRGDLAAAKAIALAPKSAVKQVRSAMASVKASAAQSAGGATGSTSTTGATG